jgi:hypothetical protein
MHEGIDQVYSSKNDHMFVIYHPNTSAWTKYRTGFNFADDDGYYFTSQNVPLGAPKGEDVTLENVRTVLAADPGFYDSLRGDDLLASQESYRGLPSITINATGLSAASVAVNATGQTETVSGGALNLTIATPSAGLMQLTPATAAQYITFPATDPRNKHPHSADALDTWSVGGNSGNYAEPWVTHPSDPTQFLVLELTLNDNKKLERYFENAQFTDDREKSFNDTRTVKYVYVDKDVVLHRVMRADASKKEYLGTVALSLKTGWNLVEIVTQADPDPGKWTSDDPSKTSIWISGGITHGQGMGQITSYTYREIPWVAR